jgi:hypothetical protein
MLRANPITPGAPMRYEFAAFGGSFMDAGLRRDIEKCGPVTCDREAGEQRVCSHYALRIGLTLHPDGRWVGLGVGDVLCFARSPDGRRVSVCWRRSLGSRVWRPRAPPPLRTGARSVLAAPPPPPAIHRNHAGQTNTAPVKPKTPRSNLKRPGQT